MSRTFLSTDSDWALVNGAQDLRGFAAVNGAGVRVGTVREMIVDTDAELVSAVLLDTGDEIPAFDLTIGDGVVYLAGAIPGAVTATDPLGLRSPDLDIAPVGLPNAIPPSAGPPSARVRQSPILYLDSENG